MNKKMFHAAFQIGFATLVAKGLLFLKDIFLVSRYGASKELDLFIYSLTLVMLVVNFLGNPFQLILTKTLSKLDVSKRHQERQALISSTITFLIFSCIIFSFLVLFFEQSKNPLVHETIFILIAFAVFSTLNLACQSVLESRSDFFIGSLAQGSLPLITILAVWLFPNVYPLKLLAWAAVVGAFAEFIVVYFRAKPHEIKLHPSLSKPTPQFVTTLKQSAIYLSGSFFISFIDVIDQSMALFLGVGSVTAWSYGAKIPLFLNLIIGGALAKVLLPQISKQLEGKDLLGANQTLIKAVLTAFVASSLAVLVLYPLTPVIVRILFERGSVTSETIVAIIAVQKIYLLSVIPFSCSLLFSRALLALERPGFIAFAALINLLSKVIFNIYFVERYGIVGLSYGTVGMYCTALITLFLGYIYYSKNNR